jgi:hypothetical protein
MSSHLLPEISAHLLAATPTCHYLEYVDWADAILEEPLQIQDGLARVPDRPGHRAHVEIGSREGTLAGPLISHLALGRFRGREAVMPEAQASINPLLLTLITMKQYRLLHPPLSLKRSATATGFGDYRRSKKPTGHLSQGIAIGESAKQCDQGRFTKDNAPHPVQARTPAGRNTGALP